MASSRSSSLPMKALLWAGLVLAATLALAAPGKSDPCAAIAGKRWVAPSEARACLTAAPIDYVVKNNTLEVLTKTLAFHTSTNYQVSAPAPFENDVHEDLLGDLARFGSRNDYKNEFEFSLDVYRAFRRVNDGHCAALNLCYDSLYVTYLPTPLVLITELDGSQNVYIAPEAYDIAQAEFADQLEFWEEALPDTLKGNLRSLSGARVLLIDGEDPFVAVNANTLTTGGYQSFGTRQNSFFSSYTLSGGNWNYVMGNFAQQVHPLKDEVHLTIRRPGSGTIDAFSLPYRSRFGSNSKNFTDFESYRANNCVAQKNTNGGSAYEKLQSPAIEQFEQQPPLHPLERRKHAMNTAIDSTPLSDIALPEYLHPAIPEVGSGSAVERYYLLDDGKTGVLMLGSFSRGNFTDFGNSLLHGLVDLKGKGANRLIVDVSNNGGGYICVAHWLHRLVAGSKKTTEPQAGLDTTTRAGPLAQLIVKRIVNDNADPDNLLGYNPRSWKNASDVPFADDEDWLDPAYDVEINGRSDKFSQRMRDTCQPFEDFEEAPEEALFESNKVVIVSNGRCASSCSLFSITMSKLEGAKTVVVGGKNDVEQQYCGTVGGQSVDFTNIDTQLKTTHLKNHTLAPPDFLANMVQGLTWRLGYGIEEPNKPEEWQEHTADYNLPLTLETANNPRKIWEQVVATVFEKATFEDILRVQE